MIELYDGLEFGGFVLRASETGREQLEHAQAASEQLVLKANYQNIHIPLDSILYIKALDNYISMSTAWLKYLMRNITATINTLCHLFRKKTFKLLFLYQELYYFCSIKQEKEDYLR